MAKLTVSAIVPTFNRCALLGETLNAVLAQTRAPDEVIVVDDGSSDATGDVVARYGARVRYLRQDNAGKATALNRAIAAATGDVIWVCDDDDIPIEGCLARLCNALQADADAGFAYGLHDELVEAESGWTVQPAFAPERYEEPLRIEVLRRCFIFQPGMLVRRDCYTTLGGFDAALFRSQDYDMLIRLAHRFRGIEVAGPVFHQRTHAGIRGPAHEQTAAADRRTAWLKYDRQVFAKAHTLYALSDYLAPPARLEDPSSHREALLRRASVMARRGLWPLTAADVTMAAHVHGVTALSAAECRDLASVFDWAGYGLFALADSAVFFAAIADLPPVMRRQAARAVTRPLPRRLASAVRRRDRHEATTILRAAARAIGAGSGMRMERATGVRGR